MSTVNLIDKDGTDLIFDPATKSLHVIEHLHREAHEGELFWAYHIYSAVANLTTVYLVVNTAAAEYVHANFLVDTAGEAQSSLIQAPTATAGTAVIPYNLNANYVDTTNVTVEHTPGAPSGGTTKFPQLLSSVLGTESRAPEKVLLPSTKYVLSVTNTSGAAKNMGLGIMYYVESVV